MPEIDEFLKKQKKKSTSSGDWNLTSLLTTPKATTPQRRPGRLFEGDLPETTAAEEVNGLHTGSKEEARGSQARAEFRITSPSLNASNASPHDREATNFQTDNNPELTYGKPTDKPTENGREIYGKPTDKPTENGRETATPVNLRKSKPTDTPTGNLRKMDGQYTEIERLVGFQRDTFLALALEAKEGGFSDDLGNRITPPINGNLLAQNILKRPYKKVKDVIYELKVSGFLTVQKVKNGRGGFVQFLIKKDLYQAFLLNTNSLKSTENGRTIYGKPTGTPTEQSTEANPIVVVPNLNSLNTTNTQNGDEPCFVIPNELSGKVSRRQLSEFVASGKISESDLQLSLDAFAYDLKNKLVSSKYSSNPVALLIGAIKNNGSYNSAKYVEALKSELKPFIQVQRETTAEKTDLKNSKEWAEFQKFKSESPESYKKFEEKMANFGFKGDMLEDFTFLEFKKSVLQINEETNLNPLRPVDGRPS